MANKKLITFIIQRNPSINVSDECEGWQLGVPLARSSRICKMKAADRGETVEENANFMNSPPAQVVVCVCVGKCLYVTERVCL